MTNTTFEITVKLEGVSYDAQPKTIADLSTDYALAAFDGHVRKAFGVKGVPPLFKTHLRIVHLSHRRHRAGESKSLASFIHWERTSRRLTEKEAKAVTSWIKRKGIIMEQVTVISGGGLKDQHAVTLRVVAA